MQRLKICILSLVIILLPVTVRAEKINIVENETRKEAIEGEQTDKSNLSKGIKVEKKEDGNLKRLTGKSGKIFMGENDDKASVKQKAHDYAIRNAMEQAGVLVLGKSDMLNGDLIHELISITSEAFIENTKILVETCGGEGGNLFCMVELEAEVKPMNLDKHRLLKVMRASIQEPDKAKQSKKPVFQENDEIQVKVTLNEDAYLSIFSVDQEENVYKLFPNPYKKNDMIPARSEFVFPDDALRTKGIKLRVATPEGKQKATENVVIIATKEDGHFLEDPALKNPKWTDLSKELKVFNNSKQSPWTVETLGYEVRK
ncbi:MAG: DUF4384 domain-containing protein [Nitrospirae bacterium]|nr:DUF4384 domain-containing protein [Nitrospirota bacterium]